jgi:hypothetical protein
MQRILRQFSAMDPKYVRKSFQERPLAFHAAHRIRELVSSLGQPYRGGRKQEDAVTEDSDPFFERPGTCRTISRVSEWDAWTIYIGAGGSVDRTGLTWERWSIACCNPTYPMSAYGRPF